MYMIRNKRASEILHEVGVDVVGLVDFADTIFELTPGEDHVGEEKQLTLAEFMKVVLDLRGDQNAKVRDIMGLRKYINACFLRLERKLIQHVQVAGRSHTSRQSGDNPLNLVEKPVRTAAPVTKARNPLWAAPSEACSSVSVWRSLMPKGSQEVETVSLNSLQEQINMSLQRIRLTHERELAGLHAENLKLLDKLKDLGAAAGKSLGAVLQVAASVPGSPTAARMPSLPHHSTLEQPRMQFPDAGMDGIAVVTREGKAPFRFPQGPVYAAVDPCNGNREPAKQGPGSNRLSMDMLMEEARRSFAKND